jgi:hypothetical protein
MDDSRRTELVGLSRALGLPERDLAVFGEGNTSARLDDEHRRIIERLTEQRLAQLLRDPFHALR